MTFVGKILVLLIMAFSLVFLGISTVAFTTAKNWKAESEKQSNSLKDVQGKLRDSETKSGDAKTKLDSAIEEHKKALAARETRIADLERQTEAAKAEMNTAVKELEAAQKNAGLALAEANARRDSIKVVTDEFTKAQRQANDFAGQNDKLKDDIRILQREKTTAEENNKDLRKFNGSAIAYLRQKGIPVETISKLDPTSVAPPVQGEVKELNATRRSMEITIGSDDGIAIGQELYVFRIQPRAEYIGKVKIVSVYPDKAVAEIIGNTVNGKKVQEKDIVSSSFDNAL